MPDFGGPCPQLDWIEKIIKKADRVAKIALVVSIIALAAADKMNRINLIFIIIGIGVTVMNL